LEVLDRSGDHRVETVAREGDDDVFAPLATGVVHDLYAAAPAGVFRSLGQDRRQALWAVRRLPDDDPLPCSPPPRRASAAPANWARSPTPICP